MVSVLVFKILGFSYGVLTGILRLLVVPVPMFNNEKNTVLTGF